MREFESYLTIPFKFNGRSMAGADCWGLVWVIYRDLLSITLPTYNDVEADNARAVAKVMMAEKNNWQRVNTPQKYDVVMMDAGKDWLMWHVGIMMDNTRFLHIEPEQVHPTVSSLTQLGMPHRIKEFWRYVS